MTSKFESTGKLGLSQGENKKYYRITIFFFCRVHLLSFWGIRSPGGSRRQVNLQNTPLQQRLSGQNRSVFAYSSYCLSGCLSFERVKSYSIFLQLDAITFNYSEVINAGTFNCLNCWKLDVNAAEHLVEIQRNTEY